MDYVFCVDFLVVVKCPTNVESQAVFEVLVDAVNGLLSDLDFLVDNYRFDPDSDRIVSEECDFGAFAGSVNCVVTVEYDGSLRLGMDSGRIQFVDKYFQIWSKYCSGHEQTPLSSATKERQKCQEFFRKQNEAMHLYAHLCHRSFKSTNKFNKWNWNYLHDDLIISRRFGLSFRRTSNQQVVHHVS